ncbi:hypothetical protein L0128_04070 [candidate division KSB1 bacterium]|nr:hypothetical protein [candidate division KSB1 bacterium]
MQNSKIVSHIFHYLFLGMLVSSIAKAQSGDDLQCTILYDYQKMRLKDSRWGKVALFQRGMSQKLQEFGLDSITADGAFGQKSKSALKQLLAKPGWNDLNYLPEQPLFGTIHTALWTRMLPTIPPPTVAERAFALVLAHEGTDYDRVEWNYGTSDDKSALTWGPFGATIGWGNEVRFILQRIQQQHPDTLKTIFGAEYPAVSRLLAEDAANGYRIMQEIYNQAERRQAFKVRLQALGATALAQQAYDWAALKSDFWLKPNFRKLYTLIPHADSLATEIDYAFFLDLSAHASISGKRVQRAQVVLDSLTTAWQRPLSPAERRRAIANVFAQFVHPNWRADRMGRNVVFYIDGIPEADLTTAEKTSWQARTQRRASQFGLFDQRRYYPDFLKAQ